MSEWVWQGWIGPTQSAVAGKAITDNDSRTGLSRPMPGESPDPVDTDGTLAEWAVQTRAGSPIPCPAGCRELRPDRIAKVYGV